MRKKQTLQAIIVLLIAAAAVCGYFFVREYFEAQQEVKEYTRVQNEYTTIINPQTYNPNNDAPLSEAEDSPEVRLPYVNVDFEALLRINPDTVGWIAIPNSVINYPVMQAANNTKYLNLSFEGNQSRAGTPFVNMNNDMQNLDMNTIIYGHNMGTGRADMFSTLLLYKDYEYFTANKYIQFDTIHHLHGFWEIFAIIELDVSNTDFLYQQLNFQSNDEFYDWISRASELSMHTTNMHIYPHEHILTLSTCDRGRYGRNGRLIILAVRLQGT